MLKNSRPKKDNVLKKNIFLEVSEGDYSLNIEAPLLRNIYIKTGRLPAAGNILMFLNTENLPEYVFVLNRIFNKNADEEHIILLCNKINE